jgi:hypothetical protein
MENAMNTSIKMVIFALSISLLSGCLGGPVAVQIARSIATNIADKSVAKAMDVDEKPNVTQPAINQVLLNNGNDPYMNAVLDMEIVKPTIEQEPIAITEASLVLESNPMVKVEFYNLLTGVEKNALVGKAQTINKEAFLDSNANLWNVGVGAIKNSHHTQEVIFLIPPEFGKPASGSTATVEINTKSQINIARYINQ